MSTYRNPGATQTKHTPKQHKGAKSRYAKPFQPILTLIEADKICHRAAHPLQTAK
jgi:hypothetical protein